MTVICSGSPDACAEVRVRDQNAINLRKISACFPKEIDSWENFSLRWGGNPKCFSPVGSGTVLPMPVPIANSSKL